MQNFALLTEGVTGGRKRIRREYLPELAAWLHMRAQEYTKILERIGGARERLADPTLLNAREHALSALAVMSTLLRTLGDGFGRGPWEESRAYIADVMGIEIDQPLPDIDKVRLSSLPIPEGK